jgi:peptidoglycan/xylan/chitin deacetylase (PgdA/CDA1 family)
MSDPGSAASFRRRRVKAALGALLFRSGLHRLLLRGRGVVAVFHRVDDRLRGNPIALGRDEFAAYCDFFARHFTVLPLGEMVRRLHVGEPVGGCLSITFDDGYLDNFCEAAPELRARNLPACFFVSTGLVESDARPWWDAEHGARAEWMSWEQVRALRAQGFEVGGHTRTHADLGVVAGDDARAEIADARAELEARLGAPVTLFSYPFGRPHQITPENRARVAEAGFECCFSAFGGTLRPGDDPFHARRTPVSNWHLSPAHFGFEVLFG